MISSASIASGDCGRKPIAVKANTQRIGSPTLTSAAADPDDFLIEQRDRRTVGTAVRLGQSRALLRQVQHHPGGNVVEVDEAGSGGSAPRHAESIGKPGSM